MATTVTHNPKPTLKMQVGQLYGCAEQSEVHGGDQRSILPTSEGRVTLIRYRPDMKPDGPRVIDHGRPGSTGSRLTERVRMLRRQGEPLPVYRRRVRGGAWEYLGRYQVRSVTDDAREVAERNEITGRDITYVIRLEGVK
ncbi:MAG: hypothetical protein M3R38_15360 [Actinomycetota bacterium]|nr:hypothetical protein [Actinomycetota bacterium]